MYWGIDSESGTLQGRSQTVPILHKAWAISLKERPFL
jgi:hypothetical protein